MVDDTGFEPVTSSVSRQKPLCDQGRCASDRVANSPVASMVVWLGSWVVVTHFVTHTDPTALVCIAGAERNYVRHLAPSAGAWGLAPTLPNVLERGSVAGSVPTGSSAPSSLVISRRPGARIDWMPRASGVRLGTADRQRLNHPRRWPNRITRGVRAMVMSTAIETKTTSEGSMFAVMWSPMARNTNCRAALM